MKKIIFLVISLIIALVFLGLWANQMFSNNDLRTQLSSSNTTITQLQQENETLKQQANPRYFKDSNELSLWLNQQSSMSSETGRDYYENALLLQRKALKDGYIISASYTIYEGGIIVTCDVYTETGILYYFDPEIREIKKGFSLEIGGIY